MKPAPFRHIWADSPEVAVAKLAEHRDDDARVIAGGQSLVPMMALRLATPSVLVDVSRCDSLRGAEVVDGVLRVGAAVTDRALERDPEIARGYPLLVACLRLVGHPEIRARGTVCGSIAHADPAAELPALLLATEGVVEALGAEGTRRIPAATFFAGPYMTALGEGELITAVELPIPPQSAGWAVLEVARRQGDFALVGVVALLDLDQAGRCATARVGLFGVSGTPVRARATEGTLVGRILSDEALDEAAAVAFEGIEPAGDIHGSAEYRRVAGRALVRRALAAAAQRASRAAVEATP